MLSDSKHQFGGPGNGQFLEGDQNVFGRFYMSSIGLGIIYGEESATAVPHTWECSTLLSEGCDASDVDDVEAANSMAVYPNPSSADFNLPPVKIFLEKTSPVGAGLGGGSADAAFALKMLNELFSLGLDDPALASYAARLGSDCAFFIYNRPMLGTGRGEILEPYDLEGMDFSGNRENQQASYDLRIVIPEGVAVSTADAYRGITPREVSPLHLTSLLEALSKPVEQWRDCLMNDFETTVFAKYPEIAAVKQRMYDDGAVYAAMSGSGSSVFALFPRK